MELRVLRYYLAIVREENILRAAESLHITQPALSRQIAQLEEEAGAKLFIRGSRKITLTDAGILLKRRAEEIVSLADKTEQELAELKNKAVTGTVTIGCGEVNAMKRIARMLGDFKKEYPDVRFEFSSENADSTKEKIEKGLLDFGLLLEPVDYDKFDHIRMNVAEPWVALMRADSPLAEKPYVTADDLKGQKLIMPRRKLVVSVLEKWFGDALDEKDIYSSNNLLNNAAVLVEAGLGVALGIDFAPSLYDGARFAYRKLYPELVFDSVLVWKKNQTFGVAAECFRDFLIMSSEHNKL